MDEIAADVLFDCFVVACTLGLCVFMGTLLGLLMLIAFAARH